MAKDFSAEEKRIRELFSPGTIFRYKQKNYCVIICGKPTCHKGEPKTDIYINAQDRNGIYKEFKISFKKYNADFLENKISAERARYILGETWNIEISHATKELRDKFENKPLIYKSRKGQTREGSITVGWKFEFVNKLSGELVGKLDLTHSQIVDIYAGTNLPQDKRDARVNGNVIKDSGVANYMLTLGDPLENVDDIINSIISIEDYVNEHPNVYFACKALNYRSKEDKWDSNRPLSVYVEWNKEDDQLVPVLHYDFPLEKKGNDIVAQLKETLNEMGIENTDDITEDLVPNRDLIYER